MLVAGRGRRSAAADRRLYAEAAADLGGRRRPVRIPHFICTATVLPCEVVLGDLGIIHMGFDR